MGIQRNIQQNIELTCYSLKEAKNFLADADKQNKDNKIKDNLKNSINDINTALNQCQSISREMNQEEEMI